MPTDTLSVLVLIFVAIAILALVVTMIRTPFNRWFSTQPRTIEENLQAPPESAQARVISKNRRKAVIQALPWLILGIPLVYYAIAAELSSNSTCMTLFGLNGGFVSLVIMSHVLPGVFLVYSLLLPGCADTYWLRCQSMRYSLSTWDRIFTRWHPMTGRQKNCTKLLLIPAKADRRDGGRVEIAQLHD